MHRLDSAHTDLATTVSTHLAPELAALRGETLQQLALHHTQLGQLIAAANTEHNPPINWPALTADQAIKAWENLATWIAHVLVPWYETSREELPDCWALHKPAVTELSWLHTTYLDAFHPGAPAHHAADWHTRWRPTALQRLREVIPRRGVRHCGPGQHLASLEDRPPHQPPPQPPAPGPVRPQLPGEQLAERHHWQPFLTQAIAADHAWRLDHDAPA
jgi:hypothetical protein